MKTIAIRSLPAMFSMLLLSGSLLADEPAGQSKALPPGAKGAAGRAGSRYANDPPPTRKIVYKKIGERELSLHVFEPAAQEAKAKRPAIVFFHGGAWAIGNPDQFYYQCDYLAKRGLWAASAEYRLTAPGAGIKIADIVLDAKDAVRYVRSHAEELSIDSDRIAAAGGSAGGHLAAATAVAPEENPPGTVSGKANLLVLFNPALFYPSAGKTVTLDQFTKDTPPAILFYGTKDDMLQYGMDCLAQSRRLGFPLRLMTAKDAGHSFFNDQPWRDRTLYESDRFLAEHGYLKGPPTVEPRAGRWVLDEVKEPLAPKAPEDKSPPQKGAGAGSFTPSAGAADPARADAPPAARDREVRDLVASLNNTEVDALQDSKSKERTAVEKLQQMSEHAAPAVAKMLADGHKNRKEPKGWIQVYLPLYVLKGMGEHAQVALPDVIKALDDGYGPVAGAAAEVLGNMGPAAKGAVPDLLRVWEKSRKIPGRPNATKALADALKKLDPAAAEKAGIE